MTEKTAKNFMGLLYCRTLYISLNECVFGVSVTVMAEDLSKSSEESCAIKQQQQAANDDVDASIKKSESKSKQELLEPAGN